MSNVTAPPVPGFANQEGVRIFFRVAGVVVTATALVFLLIGGIDFFSSMNSSEGPTELGMFFVGLPMLGIGGWCLQAGFLRVGARYVSGEVSPGPAAPVSGPYCRSCGTRNDADARFCDSCGSATA